MSISAKRSNRNDFILLGAIIMYILVICCPFIDYYIGWQLTMLPVGLMLIYLMGNREMTKKTVSVVILGLILVLFRYWFINRRDDFLLTVVNGIITWVPCLIAILCVYQVNDKSQKLLLQFSLIVLAVTSYTTILGLEIFPKASRELAGVAVGEDRSNYMLLNIGGFDFIYAITLAIPVVFWMIRYTKRWMKILNVIIFLLFLYCIYMSSYATAFLIVLVVIVLLLIDYNPRWKPYIIYIVLFAAILMGTGALSAFFRWLSSSVESEYVADRLLQVSLLLEGNSAESISTDTSNERVVLLHNAWVGFLNSPLWGNNIISWNKSVLSGHSLLLDIMSASGILGVFFFVSIFYQIYKKVFEGRFNSLVANARIIWISFIILSIFNPSSFAIIYLVIFLFAIIIDNQSRVSYNKT